MERRWGKGEVMVRRLNSKKMKELWIAPQCGARLRRSRKETVMPSR